MKQRGVTFVEVMVASLLTALIAGSISTAFAVVVKHQTRFGAARKVYETREFFESRVRVILQQAVFSTSDTENTYFKGDSVSGDTSVSDRLTLTTAGQRLSGTAISSDETDFAARNQSFGAVGGVTETSLCMTPVGEANGLQGLFLRRQTPADTDTTTGGYESLLNADVATVQFEYYDGSTWATSWDTSVDPRLPAAVRVTYSLTSDLENLLTFVVKIPQTVEVQVEAGAP